MHSVCFDASFGLRTPVCLMTCSKNTTKLGLKELYGYDEPVTQIV